ncbi:hypothetical protein LCGC14_2060630 [marine sediment metagenome]|uniref:Uncharacterized protein n=1 Tax=marine sediment metagenome TaxID=412755 RepID=A0A0F9ELG5_9ZZZZ
MVACGFTGFAKKVDIQGEVASVCDYKVTFIYRGQFRPGEEGEKDFYHSVDAQMEWLWKRYEVLSLEYKYDFDMTQNLILRFAIIKYKGVKNE